LKPGDSYGSCTVKSVHKIQGAQAPIKAYYDDGKPIENKDDVLRMVLDNGMIHYVKL